MTSDVIEGSVLARADRLLVAGRLADAASLYEVAAGEEQHSDLAYFRLAALAYQQKQLDRSEACLQHAVRLNPHNAEYHYTLARVLRERQAPGPAEASLRAALALDPDYVAAWISLGNLLRATGRASEAETCQRRALSLSPNSVEATINLGNVLLAAGRQDEAAACYRRAIELNPGAPEAHYNLGRILLETADRDSASLCFRRALDLNPHYFEAALDLGKCLCASGSLAEAIEAFERAAQLRPDSKDAAMQLANIYFEVRQFDRAQAEFERVLRLDPDAGAARVNLASLFANRGHFTKAQGAFEAALARDPDNPWVRWNYALFLLAKGDFARGWDCYEARTDVPEVNRHTQRSLGPPRWAGEDLDGKTLLITSEQGLGDEIMFASTFAEASRDARGCIIECDQRLKPLFQRSFPSSHVYGVERAAPDWDQSVTAQLSRLPAFDCWVPAGSLPRHVRGSRDAFPAHRGYLKADAGRVEAWRARLAALDGKLKIGLSWRGGTLKSGSQTRSVDLERLLPILTLKGATFVSLQYTDCRSEITALQASSRANLHHWQEAIDDYDETAALICALDLVVSVCTAAIHLAGGLGRPVWVMAPFLAEWRYGREGRSMPWYPSATVFRQPRPGAWGHVIREVERALRDTLRDGVRESRSRGEPG